MSRINGDVTQDLYNRMKDQDKNGLMGDIRLRHFIEARKNHKPLFGLRRHFATVNDLATLGELIKLPK